MLRQAAGVLIVAASLAGLGGCQGSGAIGGGEGLFHDLEGGAVSEQRPPPPGVDDPYPNLGTIPKRPPAPDIVAEQKLADELATQRDQASRAAEANPLTPRAAPPPLPKPTPPDPNANRVTVDAAATPPPPSPAPKSVAQPDTKPAAGPASDIPTLASVPAVPTAVVAGPLPTLAAAPPALPTGLGALPSPPGLGPTAGVTAVASASPTPAASAPTSAKPASAATPSLLDRLLSNTPVPIPTGDTVVKIPAPPVAASVLVDFTPGSAELPPSANLNLRRFALAHKGVPVTITGHGEDVLPGSDPQSRALDLALRRAQAIAAALGVAGIPASNLRVRAEAAGHGGNVTL